jgi:hypothetical protein
MAKTICHGKNYRLTKWVEVGLSIDSNNTIHQNMNHKHLITIAEALVKPENETIRDQLIEKIATDDRWKDLKLQKS